MASAGGGKGRLRDASDSKAGASGARTDQSRRAEHGKGKQQPRSEGTEGQLSKSENATRTACAQRMTPFNHCLVLSQTESSSSTRSLKCRPFNSRRSASLTWWWVSFRI